MIPHKKRKSTRELTLSESRAKTAIAKIPRHLRSDFLADALNHAESHILPQTTYRTCPVCGKPYDSRDGDVKFGHSYEDDYSSNKTRWCERRDAVPRGYIYTAHKMPVY